ncbi:MAG: DUF6089 family protein [Cyclobacteriaceae bacterium]
MHYINLRFSYHILGHRLLLLLGIFVANIGLAQQHEVGFGLGAMNYTGDLARSLQIANFRPGVNVLYRYNYNEAISFRGSLTGGLLYGDDEPPFDVLAANRDQSFSLGMLELSAVLEYHFLNFRENINLLRWSPYFFLGTGFTFFGNHEENTEDYSNLQPVLPFGLGFKYIVNPRWHVGVEGGVRKTFFDYIDNVSGADLNMKNYAYGNQHDNDWYYYLGFTLNYTFYTIPCPYHFD